MFIPSHFSFINVKFFPFIPFYEIVDFFFILCFDSMKILFLLALLATVSNALINSLLGDCTGKLK